jgi:hypothetical protein
MKGYVLFDDDEGSLVFLGIFSKEEDAEEERFRRDHPSLDIADVEIDPPLTKVKEDYKKGMIHNVSINVSKGNIVPLRHDNRVCYRNPEKTRTVKRYYNTDCNYLDVMSPISEEHAIEVAKEERLKYLKGSLC